MYRHAYEPRDHQYAGFRHFFDQNALTLRMFAIGALASLMALPAFI